MQTIGTQKKRFSRLFFGIGLFFVAAFLLQHITNQAIAAAPPAIITYQGKLLTNNVSATTTQQIKFVLYDAVTNGNAIYSASNTTSSPSAIAVTPNNGFFSVDIGGSGTNSLDPTIFQNNSSIYLEITINGEVLSPRKQITASPFAFNAKYLNGIMATSSPATSTYIPVSDANGNFNLNQVSSTRVTAVSATDSTQGLTVFHDGQYGTLNSTSGGLKLQVGGTDAFTVSSTGDAVLGTGMSPLNAKLHVQDVLTDSVDLSANVVRYGTISYQNVSSNPTAVGTYIANYGLARQTAENLGIDLIGTSGLGYLSAGAETSGAVTGVQGAYAVLSNSISSGSVAALRTNQIVANSTIGTSYGLYIPAIDASTSTITTAYGAKIDSPGTGDTQWSLAVGTGNSYVEGNLNIGSVATSSATLSVNGGILATGSTGSTPVSGAGTRLMWIPEKAAFRAGIAASDEWDDGNIGLASVVLGSASTARGTISAAIGGFGHTANGIADTIVGGVFNTTVSSTNGTYGSTIVGGIQNTAYEGSSMIGSIQSTASGTGSIMLGGYQNTLSGNYSVVLGGFNNDSVGTYSLAGGNNSYANGNSSFAYGTDAWAENGGTAFGFYTSSTGASSLATGYFSRATGDYSLALGNNTLASGHSAFAVGAYTTALGSASVASGFLSTASGTYSNAAGWHASAMGEYSHAIGNYVTTTGKYSFAFGNSVSVTGESSMAFRPSTFPLDNPENDFRAIVSADNTIALMRANVIISGNENNITSVPARLTIYDGAIMASGTTGGTPGSGAGTRLMWIPSKAAFRAGAVGFSAGAHWDDAQIGLGSVAFGYDNRANGDYSFSGGWENIASSTYSFVYGRLNTLSNGLVAMGYANNVSGTNGIALGSSNVITGDYAVSLGSSNVLSGQGSISIGGNEVSSYYGTGIGYGNNVSGRYNTAIGHNLNVSGSSSIALGLAYSGIPAMNTTNTLGILGGRVIITSQSATVTRPVADLVVNGTAVFGTTTAPSTPYKVFIDAGTSTNFGLGVNGIVQGSGYITASTTLDLAEQYPINENCTNQNNCPEAGDTACVTTSGDFAHSFYIEKCSAENSEQAVGIVSTDPGFTLGGLDSPHMRKVALAGRVPLKISTKNGTISPGDRLTTSDIPGVAVKAVRDGVTIGVALEAATADGTITAFVNRSYQSPTLLNAFLAAASSTYTNNTTDQTFLSGLMKAVLTGLRQVGLSIENSVLRIKRLIVDDQICINQTCIDENQLKQIMQQTGTTPASLAPSPTFSPPLPEATSTPPTDTTPTTTTPTAEPSPETTTTTPAPEPTPEATPTPEPAPTPTTSTP